MYVHLRSSALFGMFDCNDYGQHGSFLRSDLSIDCDSEMHQLAQYYALISMLSPVGGPIGYPVMVAFLLWNQRSRIAFPSGATNDERLWNRRNDPRLGDISFLFTSFRTEKWYFEVIDCLRRLMLTSLLVVFGSQSTRIAVAIFGAGCFVVIQSSLRPYVHDTTNVLALVTNCTVYVIFFAAFLLHNDNLDPNGAFPPNSISFSLSNDAIRWM